MTSPLNPTSSSERIDSLDFLRGFAILGILIMNIQSFSMPGAAYINPEAYGDLTGINKWVWILSHTLADMKFMAIFSILFGAGVVLVTQKAENKTGKSAGLHYKRTFWLLVIGLIHAHLIWYGDILVIYALCAFFVYLFRKMSPKKTFIIGIIFISIHTLIYGFFGMSLEFMPPEGLESIKSGWRPSEQEIQKEISAITGSLSEQVSFNSDAALMLETMMFFMLFLWRAGGLMLVGMALYKWGVLSAQRSHRFYIRGLWLSWVVGFPIVIYGVYKNFSVGWSYDYSMFIGSQFNYWGSLFVAFGYICLIMLVSRSQSLLWFRKRLSAVGQMALTNYITQSLLCVLLFYGIGFGLFGQLERIEQAGIIVLVWILQVSWSQPWLERYRFGPLEWAWRSLTYGKVQPMKKHK